MVAVLYENVGGIVNVGLGEDQVRGGVVDGGGRSFNEKQFDLLDGLADIGGS